jgi:hypothetical protein
MTELKKNITRVKLMDLIRQAKTKHAGAFGKVPDKRVLAIVTAVMNEISGQIDKVEEGVIAYPKLGRFVVKKLAKTTDGEKTTQRRVIFTKLMRKK